MPWAEEALVVKSVQRGIDRFGVRFDDDSLVADAGLLTAGTLMSRLGMERLLDRTVRLAGRVGGARPGRKVLTLVASMLCGGSQMSIMLIGCGRGRLIGCCRFG